jgi:hypothetical protein
MSGSRPTDEVVLYAAEKQTWEQGARGGRSMTAHHHDDSSLRLDNQLHPRSTNLHLGPVRDRPSSKISHWQYCFPIVNKATDIATTW